MSKNPLVIDGQLLQTAAWDRGMGHYCRSLLTAFSELDGLSEITLVLNKNLPLNSDKKDVLQRMLQGAKIVELDLPTLSGDIAASKRLATNTLDIFLEDAFGSQSVDFLILQLFTFDYCAAFPSNARKLVICYDLIPLVNWAAFSGMFAAHMYFPHLPTLLEADEILAISETTKLQIQTQLGVSADRVKNINGAYIERPIAKDSKAVPKNTRFVLMPSADLPHKNNVAAVKAFAQFNRELGYVFSLVITSTISEETQRLLSCYTDKLIFTGNIADTELEYLYSRCEALLFISSIEGLGLPILEAVQHDKPVACSSIAVFKEISKEAFYYCEPQQIDSVVAALTSAITKTGWETRQKEYQIIRQVYSWESSANKLLDSLGDKHSQSDLAADRPELTVVLPHPSTTSGSLGLLAQSLIPALLKQSRLTCYVAEDNYVNEKIKPFFIPYALPVHNSDHLLTKDSITNPVYFIDDTSASIDIFRSAILRPGKCYVTSRHLEPLLKELGEAGYITESLASTGRALAKNNLIELLAEAGNKVYLLNQDGPDIVVKDIRDSSESKIDANDKWSLAALIVRQAV